MGRHGVKLALLLGNILVIVLIEVYITCIQALAVKAAILLQTWGKNHDPEMLWSIAEGLGPEPRMLTFVAIALLARDGTEARRLFSMRFCAHYLRWFLGVALQEPRPSWIDERVQMLHCPNTFGLPSGHAVISIVVFVPLAWKRGVLAEMLFIIWFLAMCFGRVYLGTHSTHDLFLGAVLGSSLLYLMDTPFIVKMTKTFVEFQSNGLFTVGFLLTGIANSLFWAIFFRTYADHKVFAVWEKRALKNDCSALNLFSAREGISAVMAYTGLLAAMFWNRLELAPLKTRILAMSIFVFTKNFIDAPWIIESMVLSGTLYAISLYLIFEAAAPSTPRGGSPVSKVSFGPDVEYGSISAGAVH